MWGWSLHCHLPKIAQALKHFGPQRRGALACATMSTQSCNELWRTLTCDFNGAVSALDRIALVSDVFKKKLPAFQAMLRVGMVITLSLAKDCHVCTSPSITLRANDQDNHFNCRRLSCMACITLLTRTILVCNTSESNPYKVHFEVWFDAACMLTTANAIYLFSSTDDNFCSQFNITLDPGFIL